MEFLHNGQRLVEIGAFLLEIAYFDIAVPADESLMGQFLLYDLQQS